MIRRQIRDALPAESKVARAVDRIRAIAVVEHVGPAVACRVKSSPLEVVAAAVVGVALIRAVAVERRQVRIRVPDRRESRPAVAGAVGREPRGYAIAREPDARRAAEEIAVGVELGVPEVGGAHSRFQSYQSALRFIASTHEISGLPHSVAALTNRTNAQ